MLLKRDGAGARQSSKHSIVVRSAAASLPPNQVFSIEPTRIYRTADAKQFLQEAGLSDEATLSQIDGRIMSAFIRARKPVA